MRHDLWESWLRLATQGTVLRFPSERIVVDLGEQVFGRGAAIVRQNVGSSDQPMPAVIRPARFSEAAIAIKNPGANLLAVRIPSDNLPAVCLAFLILEF